MMNRRRTAGWFAIAVLVIGVVGAAVTSAFASRSSAPVSWQKFYNPIVGYSLDYPDNLFTEGDGAEVFFVTRGRIPFLQDLLGEAWVVVRWEDEAESLRRGTWFGSDPVADIVLGGIAGKEYAYFLRDPFKTTGMVAYVIPYRDRFLSVEFLTGGELDEVQQRVLASFELTGK